jgi:post-segregation antitoxin (ccd killing protein)
MTDEFRRISLMIREDQHQRLLDLGVNMSALIRSLIDDHLSESKITLAVPEETAHLYRQVVSDTGSTDAEVEPYLRAALKSMLKDRIAQLQTLHRSIE